MPKRIRIIFAHDKSVFGKEEQGLFRRIDPYVDMYKIGLEAIYAEDIATGKSIARLKREFVQEVLEKDVFLDAKLTDIGTTVHGAARNIVTLGVKMFTVHASISDNGLSLVAEVCAGSDTMPLAVTVLSDLDDIECKSRFGEVPGPTALRFAENAKTLGFRGLVSAPKELPFLKSEGILEGMTTVAAGVRSKGIGSDDQKRPMTPAEAALAGADYVVVGREIVLAKDPVREAARIRAELDAAVHAVA